MKQYVVAIQRNGERIRYERHTYERWLANPLFDRDVTHALETAVRIYCEY
jgi:hypothetical protein